MNIKEFKVSLCSRAEVKDFIEQWHYSHNMNGVISDYCFKLTYQGSIIGAMVYGRLAMANQWKKYGDKAEDVIELRRLVCIDDTPKNTESYFIGKTLKYLKQNTPIKVVVSYADNEYGHKGTVYQATNFTKVGETPRGKVIIYNGRRWHDKTIRTKYKGELKPFAKKLKEALDNGEAYYKKTDTKNIYIYRFSRKTRVKRR